MTRVFVGLLSALLSLSVSATDTIALFEQGLAVQEGLLRFIQSRTCAPPALLAECERPLTAREMNELQTKLTELERWRLEAFERFVASSDILKNRAVEATLGARFELKEAARWRGLTRERYWKLTYAPESEEARSFTQSARVVAAFRAMLFDQFFRLAQALSETPRLRRVIEYDTPQGQLLQKTYGPALERANWQGTFFALEFLTTEATLRGSRSLTLVESYFDNYLRQSFTAQRMRERDHKVFMEEALRMARQLQRTRFTERLNRLMGRLSQFFGNTVGRVQTRSGKLKFMAQDPVLMKALKSELKPLDVLLEKTPFRLTDYFIPGFYGHVAIWLGPPEEWGSWPVLHEGKRIPLIAHPLVLKLIPQLEEDRFVVEALRIPGVTMNPLEAFMDVDDLLILRAERLADPGELILSTLKQVGKPYDFNFDVETQREIVCSELAYVVFTDEDWPTERSLGRYTIGPDQVAWKVFDNRFDVVRLYHDGKLLTDGAREKLFELIDAPGGIAPFLR